MKNNYLKYITEQIHTTVVATVDDTGRPVTSAIDMMDYDDNGLYFLTAKGKGFYNRLKKRGYLALTGMKGGDTMHCAALSIRGKVRDSFSFGGAEEIKEGYFVTDSCIGCKLCYSKCPQKCIDISSKPVIIHQKNCLHCGNCYEICPVRAIVKRV